MKNNWLQSLYKKTKIVAGMYTGTFVVVMVLNQFLFFGFCLNPVCLIAAMPHVLLITAFVGSWINSIEGWGEDKENIKKKDINNDKKAKPATPAELGAIYYASQTKAKALRAQAQRVVNKHDQQQPEFKAMGQCYNGSVVKKPTSTKDETKISKAIDKRVQPTVYRFETAPMEREDWYTVHCTPIKRKVLRLADYKQTVL